MAGIEPLRPHCRAKPTVCEALEVSFFNFYFVGEEMEIQRFSGRP